MAARRDDRRHGGNDAARDPGRRAHALFARHQGRLGRGFAQRLDHDVVLHAAHVAAAAAPAQASAALHAPLLEGVARSRRGDLPHHRASPQEPVLERGPARASHAGEGRRDQRLHDRKAAARRAAHAAGRGTRDHGERPGLDDLPACAEPRGRRQAARRDKRRARRPAAARGGGPGAPALHEAGAAGRHAALSAGLVHRAHRARRRPGRRIPDPERGHRARQPVRDAPGRPLLRGPGALPARALERGVPGKAAARQLLPLRRR